MKNCVLSVVISAMLLAGCSSSGSLDQTYTLPRLVDYTGLPTLPSGPGQYSEIIADLLILENGVVSKARLRNSSGDDRWDSAAEQRLLQWKFIPARMGEKPIRLWIRQRIVLRFEDPLQMYLAAIECENRDQADSLYKELVDGADFSQIAFAHASPESRALRGSLGLVELHQYPATVRMALLQLKEGEFTRPLQCGEHRVIFRREK